MWEDYRVGAFRRAFAKRWPGRKGILIYSNSPNWQNYVETRWLPRLREQMVVLNWSERATWRDKWKFEAAIFRRYASDREFNPMAIVFKPRRGNATL